MFVPSLSCKMMHLILKWRKSGVSLPQNSPEKDWIVCELQPSLQGISRVSRVARYCVDCVKSFSPAKNATLF
jgi:hypothetical protein